MDARVHSLLYDNPRLYDIVFPDAGETELAMCKTAFSRWLAGGAGMHVRKLYGFARKT